MKWRLALLVAVASIASLGSVAVTAPSAGAATAAHATVARPAMAGDDNTDLCQEIANQTPFETLPDGVQEYNIPTIDEGGMVCLSGAHTYAELVPDAPVPTGDAASVCADVIAVAGSNTVQYDPVVEASCEEDGAAAQCANVSEPFELVNGKGQTFGGFTLTCGHSFGSCAPAGERDEGLGSGPTEDQCAGTGTAGEVFTSIEPSAVVEIPGANEDAQPSGNVGSKHVIVCVGVEET